MSGRRKSRHIKIGLYNNLCYKKNEYIELPQRQNDNSCLSWFCNLLNKKK